MRKGNRNDLSSARSEEPEAIVETKQGQTRRPEQNAAAAPKPDTAKDFDGVQNADHLAPLVRNAGQSQKNVNAFVPLLWVLLPLLAVIIWQILSGG